MTNKTFQLGITPLRLSGERFTSTIGPPVSDCAIEIPSEDSIVEVGRSIMEHSKTWKQGRSFVQGTVRTYARPKGPTESAGWHCRVSEHSKEEATFDEFWNKLGENKAENEKK